MDRIICPWLHRFALDLAENKLAKDRYLANGLELPIILAITKQGWKSSRSQHRGIPNFGTSGFNHGYTNVGVF